MSDHTMPMRAVKFHCLLIIVSVLVCTRPSLADQPRAIYSEIHLSNQGTDQLASSSGEGSQMSSDDENNLRLSNLLHLKQSILNILSQPSVTDANGYEDEDELEKTRLTKRVFCNGFTGCGGRFRGRRRPQQPVAEIGKRLLPSFKKRPFCNSYGCFNSGKKRLNQDTIKNEAPHILGFADDALEDRIKRLFCNGYGGCQNVGKRLVVLDAEVTRAIDDRQRTLSPLSRAFLQKLASMKRAFSSTFDEDVDALIKVMRR